MSQKTAVQLAQEIQSGEVSAVSVAEAALARIEAKDGEINAFNLVASEQALAQAEAVDKKVAAGEKLGPLAGVPVAVKDNMCTNGIATTCSSKMLEGWVPPYDATVVEKLSAADAVMIGKTNMDEFAMGSSTENSAFGPTKNPLDTSRVPGGSSGGSAAAVAAGYVPLSLGSDTGGSIRQPASLCGIVGMKPTYGSVSRYGLVAYASSLDQIGPFAKNVTDSALLYDVIAGPDQRDSTSIAQPHTPVSQQLAEAVSLEGLRVGVIKELSTPGIEGFEPEVLERTSEASDALLAAGAKVDHVSVPAIKAALSAYYMIAPAEASSNLARFDGVRYGLRKDGGNTAAMMRASRTAGFGDEVKRRIMVGTYALSAGYFDAFYGKAQQLRSYLIAEFAALYKDFDVLLSPTSPCVAFGLGAKEDPVSMYLNDWATIPANLAGLPAISVPFRTGAHGLPVGVQVTAPMLEEVKMYRVAKALETSVERPERSGNTEGMYDARHPQEEASKK